MVDYEKGVGLIPPTDSPGQRKEEGGGQPGARAFPSARARKLFPLPFFACPEKKFRCSRPVKQRRERIRRAVENSNEAIGALNWMAGFSEAGDSTMVSPMQMQSMLRVDGLVHCQKPSGCIDGPEAALRSLLRGGTPYDLGTASETLASYRSELVSIPQEVHSCPNLYDVLPGDDRQFLEEESELMLKPEGERREECLPEPYWDPVLKWNTKEYHKLVSRLRSIGYFTYTLRPACKVGVFFVWKSSKTKLRMITDARRANALFADPPGVSLMTGEGLGKVEVVFDDTFWADISSESAWKIFVGLSDVRDCFHRMRVPGWLARFFAWEAVPAKLVGLDGATLDGTTLKSTDAVWPCAGSLCQGFSWSLFFAQRANEHLAGLIDPLADARLSNDQGGPVVLHVGRDTYPTTHFYVYVDNLGVISPEEEVVSKAMESLKGQFNSRGLELHGSEISEGYVEALGCVLHGSDMCTRVNPKRLWRVHHAIKGLLRRNRCTGKALEIVIGHCTFLGLLNRCSLAIFHRVYQFIRSSYLVAVEIWPSVRSELKAFMGICFLMTQDWWRQWNTHVTSSDSSLSGFGACKSIWPKELVASVGRVQERSRFRRIGSHAARESALSAAGFHRVDGEWGPIDAPMSKRLEQAGWGIDSTFQEVPAGCLKGNLWTPVFWGRWNFKENIGVLEARAVLKSVQRLALTRYGHDLRHLHLCDNLGVVLSIERCRSKNLKLLKILRQIGAYLLCRGIHLAIRWIPSELNASDKPSRIFGDVDSKLLVDLIALDDFEGFSSQFPPTRKHEQQPEAQADASATRFRCGYGAAECNAGEGTETASGRGVAVSEVQPSTCKTPGERHEAGGASVEGKASAKLTLANDRSGDCQTGENKKGDRGQRDRVREHLIRMGGREKRRQEAYLRKEGKKMFANPSGLADGKFQSDPLGVGGSGPTGTRELREEVAGDQGLHGSEWLRHEEPRANRCIASDLLQPEVPGGGGQPLWRLH